MAKSEPPIGATRRARRTIGAAVAAMALALTACTGGGAPTTTPAAPDPGATATQQPAETRTLVVGATAEPATLDPTATDAAAGTQALLYNVFETLVRIDAEGHLKPLLAQAWDVSEDRLTYTFKLSPNARFSDGTPVTAEAVAANIDRIQNGTTAPKLKKAMSVVAATAVVDPTTIDITLTRPSVTWLFDMAGAAGIVMNPAGFAAANSETAGSGPLTLGRWLPGDSIVLEKNAQYWGTPARFDEVTFRYFKDPNAMNASMLSGQLDIISNLQAPETLAQFSDTSRFTVIEGSTDAEVTLSINNGATPEGVTPGTGNEALKDVRVRKAITMAIDRQALLDTVWFGKGTLIGSMSVPTDVWYEDLTGTHPYNPEEAKRLLAEAGHPQLTLRLQPAALPYASKAAQFVASQLGAVGITAQVEELQFPARWVDTVLQKADYDLSIVAHVEPRDVVTYANPAYYWRYDNPAVQEAVARADAGTVAEYEAEMRTASRLIAEDAAAVWLFALPNLVVTKTGVTGVPENANSSLAFDVTTIAKA
ncbi:ABC transporter substrate-binding protein [Propioniciclava sinopodophylli]|uniref:ABC transporter substrate-binding protein n=1 Tax=Propioniciclava sinopodophylli TaxID=1837344 RepID=A0A4Q9KDC6_9ACTN|nr:ABC transporter substrate-binding protein [Propioniciclava sinopodophylli]TBT84660.1 ABC transporter substrate-binding protein [Propioniciclava sinopodophylli]